MTIKMYKKKIEEANNRIKDLEINLETTKLELSSNTQKLNDIYHSRAWSLIRDYYIARDRILPKNSFIRRLIKKTLSLIKKLKNYKRKFPLKNFKVNLSSRKIVFIGHSYHSKTKSTEFLKDYLKKHFELTEILDESWQGKKFPDLSFVNDSYLAVILFQNLPSPQIIDSIKNKNIIFFPMYDGHGLGPRNFWENYRDLKIINFSKTLHEKLFDWGFNSIYVQYFPKPLTKYNNSDHKVFFWQRTDKININIVEKLLGNLKTKIHIHRSIDPGYEFVKPTKIQEKKYQISYSDWFETREEAQKIIQDCDIYIAPRELEGIGMSFLEAMAMGKAVIAINNPTMNEYITHNNNGYLFNLKQIEPLNFSNIEKVKENSYQLIQNGYKRWLVDRNKIVNFIKADTSAPLVTVITVTYNLIKNKRKKSFIKCVKSVHNQTYNNIEHIIIDGASNDGTLNILKKYFKKGYITFISEPDSGIYDAMNKGILSANGRYVCFLNSDDFYHQPDGIAKSVEMLEKTGSDFSYAPVFMKFEDGKPFPEHPQVNPDISKVFFTMPFSHQTMLAKRDVLLANPFSTKYKSASDYDLVIRLCLQNYKSVFVNHTFVTYLFSGISSVNQENSINETTDVFYNNFNKLTPITQDTCKQICLSQYSKNYYEHFPEKLAKKLENLTPYFDYKSYCQSKNKLTIITITFNNPDLKRTLDSVLNQKGVTDRIDHIIVDNLSTDTTTQIVKDYINKAPFKITYIREADKERYDAMNKGIKAASGNYLSFMNAGDTFYNDDSVSNLLNSAIDRDIIYGNLNVILQDKNTIYSPPDSLNFKYFLNYALPHQASLIKKELFNTIGHYNGKYRISFDHLFFILAVCKHNCTYFHVNETIANYTFDGASSKPENYKKIETEKNDYLNLYFSEQKTQKISKAKNKAKLNTPVLFVIFNRPELTQKVFDEFKIARPKYLYVAADGPRDSNPDDISLCKQTKNILKQINWDCELHTLFRNQNFGCGHAVSKAITWFFRNVEEGIVLEDDCMPDPTFFKYCQILLDKYKNDPKIMHISGDQLVPDYKSKYSYYFSKNMNCWGWASWANRWDLYTFDLQSYDDKNISKISIDTKIRSFWIKILEMLKNKKIDTWDYQWFFKIIENNGLCINPSNNLITNIGFGKTSTHTLDTSNPLSNLKTKPIIKISHPKFIKIDINADNYIYENFHSFKKIASNRPPLIERVFKKILNKLKKITQYEINQM